MPEAKRRRSGAGIAGATSKEIVVALLKLTPFGAAVEIQQAVDTRLKIEAIDHRVRQLEQLTCFQPDAEQASTIQHFHEPRHSHGSSISGQTQHILDSGNILTVSSLAFRANPYWRQIRDCPGVYQCHYANQPQQYTGMVYVWRETVQRWLAIPVTVYAELVYNSPSFHSTVIGDATDMFMVSPVYAADLCGACGGIQRRLYDKLLKIKQQHDLKKMRSEFIGTYISRHNDFGITLSEVQTYHNNYLKSSHFYGGIERILGVSYVSRENTLCRSCLQFSCLFCRLFNIKIQRDRTEGNLFCPMCAEPQGVIGRRVWNGGK